MSQSGGYRSLRILLYAHVNLNAVDGSAFFVAGAVSLLTSSAGVEVDVVSALPVRRAVVVHEMLDNPQVTLVDPYSDPGVTMQHDRIAARGQVSEEEAATLVDHYIERGLYDLVLIRGTETAYRLSELRPSLGSSLCVYVTGVVSLGRPIDPVLLTRLDSLAGWGATLLVQTPEMEQLIRGALEVRGRTPQIVEMSPAVPMHEGSEPPERTGRLELVYTGKFAPHWNSVEMLAGFKVASFQADNMRLRVAGDYFKKSESWPSFAAETRSLLCSSPDIEWLGAMSRERARELVIGSHVGIGWRSRALDGSAELSTKLLEHGALGRGCIINPTEMHKGLFGSQYPLYAESMEDYVATLRRLESDRGIAVDAALIAREVASAYTYEAVFARLLPGLVRAAQGTRTGLDPLVSGICEILTSGERTVRVGEHVVTRVDSEEDFLALLSMHEPTERVVDPLRLGPYFAWRGTRGDGLQAGERTVAGLVLEAAKRRSTSDYGSPTLPECDAVDHDARGRVIPASWRVSSTEGKVDRRELAAALARAERLQARYDALRHSKFGGLQARYWQLRGRLRGRVTQK